MILSIPIGQEDRLALLTQVSNRLKEELGTMDPFQTQALIELTAAYAAALQALTSQRSTKSMMALAKATRFRAIVQSGSGERGVFQRPHQLRKACSKYPTTH